VGLENFHQRDEPEFSARGANTLRPWAIPWPGVVAP